MNELLTALRNNAFIEFQHLLKNTPELDIDKRDSQGQNLLMHAAIMGRVAFISQLLKTYPWIINGVDKKGRTALILATLGEQCGSVHLLLEKGADSSIKDTDGNTPLMYAAKNGNDKIAAALADKRVGIEDTDKDGSTPLIIATTNNNPDIVARLLLEANPNIAARNSQGFNSLEIAASKGFAKIVQLLLAAGADKNDPLSADILKKAKKDAPKIALALDSKGSFQERLNKIGYTGEIPKKFLDPISHQLMNNPVTFKNGSTYDLDSIKSRFKSTPMDLIVDSLFSGKTIYREELTFTNPNKLISTMIEDFVIDQEAKSAPKAEAIAKPGVENKYEKLESLLVCPVTLLPFGTGDAAAVTLSTGINISRGALKKLVDQNMFFCPVTRRPIRKDELTREDNIFIKREAKELAQNKDGKKALKRSASISSYLPFKLWKSAPEQLAIQTVAAEDPVESPSGCALS